MTSVTTRVRSTPVAAFSKSSHAEQSTRNVHV
jgi:hypothetical protein